MTSIAPSPFVTRIFDRRAHRRPPIPPWPLDRVGRGMGRRMKLDNGEEQCGRRAVCANDGASRSQEGENASAAASILQEFGS